MLPVAAAASAAKLLPQVGRPRRDFGDIMRAPTPLVCELCCQVAPGYHNNWFQWRLYRKSLMGHLVPAGMMCSRCDTAMQQIPQQLMGHGFEVGRKTVTKLITATVDGRKSWRMCRRVQTAQDKFNFLTRKADGLKRAAQTELDATVESAMKCARLADAEARSRRTGPYSRLGL